MAKYIGKIPLKRSRIKKEFRDNHVYDVPIHLYTCRNLSENGDCLNYANRPNMCRNYPYGKECEINGCTRKVKKHSEEKELTNIKELKCE